MRRRSITDSGLFDGALPVWTRATYHRSRPKPELASLLDQASALAFSWSNSACVIDPLSSNAFAEEI